MPPENYHTSYAINQGRTPFLCAASEHLSAKDQMTIAALLHEIGGHPDATLLDSAVKAYGAHLEQRTMHMATEHLKKEFAECRNEISKKTDGARNDAIQRFDTANDELKRLRKSFIEEDQVLRAELEEKLRHQAKQIVTLKKWRIGLLLVCAGSLGICAYGEMILAVTR